MSILIKSVLWCNKETDVLIEGNKIKKIAPCIEHSADILLDGNNKALIPGFVNAHTHAGMTLFRGFGDDMPLMKWLTEKIWPYEAKLTDEDVYWGSKLACLEMIKSGTTSFFDMYHKMDMTIAAVDEMGLRAVLSEACFDHFKSDLGEKCKRNIISRFHSVFSHSDHIRLAIGPHAIYTVSGQLLQWANSFAQDNDLLVHIHLAETRDEVKQCRERFGTTPIRYLNQLRVLSPRLVLAHALYVDEEEIKMLAEHDVKVVHNPASNMKLASGYRFLYKEMRTAGITVGLGTDGCSSSNNLDMVEAMKLASLLGKVWREDPEVLTCDEMLESATRSGADILRFKTGQVAEGYLADVCLVDLNIPAFTPNFNFASNLVFAANGSCIDTVICDGKILMQNKHVPGEEDILEKAARCAYDLMKR